MARIAAMIGNGSLFSNEGIAPMTITTESLQRTEAECAEGRTAPRVSLSDIEANIFTVYFKTGDEIGYPTRTDPLFGASDLIAPLTICLVVLRNGFTIIGKSAPADARNFDPELGRKLAYEDAVRQIWPLMGYALREKLAIANAAVVAPGRGMSRYIGTKVVNAIPMTRQAYNDLRGWTLPAGENGNDAGFLVEYADEQRPNVEGFQGYVSWSPADVFERAYRAI
jgi:hypothetical protein